MPTNPEDEQQINKKKYVGNDPVHIVWCENDRDYKGGIITSSFNFIHIVVYPLRNGLYKIKIEKKKRLNESRIVKFVGHLISGMVVPMEILSPLLRYTAINARKSITSKNLNIFCSLVNFYRQTLIKQTSDTETCLGSLARFGL